MKQILGVFAASLFSTVAAIPGMAQDVPSCSTDRAHEFDFWIGDWEVSANGSVVGHSVIKPILDGCVIQETWSGAGGSAGSSLNFYNPQLGKWQQFWVWRNGTTLYLTGDYAEDKMTLEGESFNREGAPVQNRITWFDNGDGTVRQRWETSADNGASWNADFDGHYSPAPQQGEGD
jgi:hypothetical protein